LEREERFHNVMTRLACDRCRELERRGEVPSWACEWWRAHKVKDLERLQQDKEARTAAKIRKQAISKLTAKEREELGV